MKLIEAKHARFKWVVVTSEDNLPGGYIISEYGSESEAMNKAQQYLDQGKRFAWVTEKKWIEEK